MVKMALLGLPVGLAFGYTLQRGGFCMNSAFREVLFSRDSRLLKGYFIAVLVQMLLLGALAGVLGISPATPPVWWLAASVGGFLFGIGMVLARGCTCGNFYRVGEGLIGAYVVITWFVLGLLAMDSGWLSGARKLLRRPTIEGLTTVDALTGIPSLAIALVLSVGLGVWIWRTEMGEASKGRWHWLEAGLAVGLVAALGWVLSSMTGRMYGLSMIQPTLAWGQFFLLGDSSTLNLAAFVVLAIPLGAAVGARQGGQAMWKLPYPSRILQQMAGGLLMGVGGGIAGGCNVGHSLSGVAALSITSIIATTAIVLGCWFGVAVIFNRWQVPR